jgi:succinate-acetate transporter protein
MLMSLLGLAIFYGGLAMVFTACAVASVGGEYRRRLATGGGWSV